MIPSRWGDLTAPVTPVQTLPLVRPEDVSRKGPEDRYLEEIEDADPVEEHASHPYDLPLRNPPEREEGEREVSREESIGHGNELLPGIPGHHPGEKGDEP